MEEGKAAAIRLEPILEVGPAANLVHRLIDDQFFEQRRRRLPGDPAQLKKTDIEPMREQRLEVVFKASEDRIAAR